MLAVKDVSSGYPVPAAIPALAAVNPTMMKSNPLEL